MNMIGFGFELAQAMANKGFVPILTSATELRLVTRNDADTEEESDRRARELKVWLSLYQMQHPDEPVPSRVLYKRASPAAVKAAYVDMLRKYHMDEKLVEYADYVTPEGMSLWR